MEMEVTSTETAETSRGPGLAHGGAAALAPLPEHLVALPGEQWSVWRTACLRSAGFPAAQVLRLSSPACIAAAEKVLAAESESEAARGRALAAVNSRLDELRRTGEWEEKGRRAPLVSALQALKGGKLPGPVASEGGLDSYLDACRDARRGREEAEADYRAAYDEAVREVSRAVRDFLRDERFSEAMIWQNRQAHHLVKRALLREEEGDEPRRSSKQRQSEELIAFYVQRYCVKNDSIGFFGPIGWADLRPPVGGLTARPGPDIMAERHVYFEGWCIDALAEKFSAGEGRRWAMPRRLPYVRFEGNALHLPMTTRPTLLSSKQAAVLGACDRRHTAAELAARLAGDPSSGFGDEEEVYRLLTALEARGLIKWSFEIPLAPRPERELRRQFERIGDEGLRAEALAALDELEAGRAAVEAAAGDVARLDAALAALEESFTRLTAESATRAEGRTYAARTLVYEDGRRDVEVGVGPDVLGELAPPLSLMLTSARWLSARLGEIYEEAFGEVYRTLSRRKGSSVIEAMDFWVAVQPLLYDMQSVRPADSVPPLFEERWAQVLGLPREGQQLQYTSAELLPRVRDAFDARGPGWLQARHHSPDVMIAAASPEAVNRGDYQFVLGEMHVASNTLSSNLFVTQHPEPEALQRYVASDLADVRLHFVIPKSWPDQTLRTLQVLIPPGALRVEVTHDAVCAEGFTSLPVRELVVEEQGGELLLRTRDSRISFGLMEAVGDAFSRLAINALNILPRAAHTPRVTIDRLVVCRETWRRPAGELDFAYVKDEAERFLAARRWARSVGLPDHIFVKVPVEVKPVYIDLSSTIYVDMFAKLIRRTAEGDSPDALVTLSEMLPGVEQSWLPDADGRRYASEFRVVARDLCGGGPAEAR
jgi:hypothetical protein